MEKKQSKNYRLRFIILSVVILTSLGLAFHFSKLSRPQVEKPAVLGAHTEQNNKLTTPTFSDLQTALPMQRINEITTDIINNLTSQVSSLASQAATEGSQLAVSTAVKPLITQINSLPEPQKSQLKQELCK